MKYAVIDISSSSLSMIVAEADARSPGNAEVVFKDRINLNLLYYLDGNNLSDRGIEKLTDALNTAKSTCRSLGVKRCYLISTAAMRSIANSEQVENEVARNTGLYVNYIDGKTEAYCDYVANCCYGLSECAALIDLGGKSIEICSLSDSDKEDMLSLEFGLLDLRRKFIGKIQPDEDEAEDIKRYVTSKFNPAGLPGAGVYNTVVLVGATCLAIYDIYVEYAHLPRTDGEMVIERKTFKKLVKYLLTDGSRSGLILNTAPEKLVSIIPAAIVLRNLFKRFGVNKIIVSDRGVKEGYLSIVLRNPEQGVCVSFEKTAEEKSSVTENAPVKKRAARKRISAKAADVNSASAPKKRGRPKKEAQPAAVQAADDGETYSG